MNHKIQCPYWHQTYPKAMFFSLTLLLIAAVSPLSAHDIWIEAHSAVVRKGEPVRLECKMGNCEDGRPNFKTAGLIPLKELETIAYLPTDKQLDLRPFLAETATSKENGSWRASVDIDSAGIAWLLQRSEQTLEHGKRVRGKLLAKTPVIISESLDQVYAASPPVAFSQPFEIVLNSSLLPSLDSVEPIEVKIIKNNTPLSGATVTFTPLPLGRIDTPQQVEPIQSDVAGNASYHPKNPGLILIACHYLDEQERGNDYDATYYSATMCLEVTRKSRTNSLASKNTVENRDSPLYVRINAETDSTNWPTFLGTRECRDSATNLPLNWTPTENIAWKANLTGHGQSSPVIWNDKIFVTSVDGPNKDNFLLSSLDLATGKLLWKVEIKNSHPVQNSVYVSRAAPTPVVDANRVIAFFESGDCVSVDHSGNVLWKKDLRQEYGPFVAEFGLGASPCQDDQKVYLLIEHDAPGTLVALSKSKGELIWKKERPAGRSWSSPAYFTIADTPQIVVSSNGTVTGYSVSDGQTLWEIKGLGGNTGTTPIDVGNDHFLIGASAGRSGENEQAAKKSNGLVQVSKKDSAWEAKLAWVNPQLSPTWASPVIQDGLAYWVNRVGVISCVDLINGELVYAERSKQSCWATPIVWKDRIYFLGKDGMTTVIRSGRKFEILATNEIVDPETFPPETTTLPAENSAQRQQSAAMFSGPTLYAGVPANNMILIRFGNQLIAIREEPK